MESLKDSVKQLPIPKDELHQHTLQGIQCAQNEKKRKQRRVPHIISFIAMIATLYIIWLQKSIDGKHFKAAVVHEEIPIIGGIDIAYILGIVASAITVLLFFIVIRQAPKLIVGGLLLLLVSLSWIWNIAYYEAHQMNQPYAFPLNVNVFEEDSDENIDLSIYYAVDKHDQDVQIASIQIAGSTYISNWDDALNAYYTYQLTKESFFRLPLKEIAKKWSGEESVIVTFSNGIKQTLNMELHYYEGVASAHGSGGGMNSYRTNFTMERLTIQDIQLPFDMNYFVMENGGYSNLTVILKQGELSEQVDLLPYTLTSDRVQIRYKPIEGYYYRYPIVKLVTNKGTMHLGLMDRFFHIESMTDIQKEVRYGTAK